MDINTFKKILGDNSISDDDAAILLERAKKKAVNHHFWQKDDEPTDEELEKFYNRYEYEIYDLGKALTESESREGLKEFTELGVRRVWDKSGTKTVEEVLSAIIPKAYVT